MKIDNKKYSGKEVISDILNLLKNSDVSGARNYIVRGIAKSLLHSFDFGRNGGRLEKLDYVNLLDFYVHSLLKNTYSLSVNDKRDLINICIFISVFSSRSYSLTLEYSANRFMVMCNENPRFMKSIFNLLVNDRYNTNSFADFRAGVEKIIIAGRTRLMVNLFLGLINDIQRVNKKMRRDDEGEDLYSDIYIDNVKELKKRALQFIELGDVNLSKDSMESAVNEVLRFFKKDFLILTSSYRERVDVKFDTAYDSALMCYELLIKSLFIGNKDLITSQLYLGIDVLKFNDREDVNGYQDDVVSHDVEQAPSPSLSEKPKPRSYSF